MYARMRGLGGWNEIVETDYGWPKFSLSLEPSCVLKILFACLTSIAKTSNDGYQTHRY